MFVETAAPTTISTNFFLDCFVIFYGKCILC